jgi:hypothetical protein
MSLPVATTITGMDSLEVLRQNLQIAQNFKPFSESEMQELRERCKPDAADGRYELYGFHRPEQVYDFLVRNKGVCGRTASTHRNDEKKHYRPNRQQVRHSSKWRLPMLDCYAWLKSARGRAG